MSEYALRKLEEKDLELVLSWRNKDEIRHNMFTQEKIPWQQHMNWFENLKTSKDKDFQIFCLDGRPIGVVNFSEIDEHGKKQCMWGFYIGEDNAPAGSGLLLGYSGIEYAFGKYEIDRIVSEVLSFNVSSFNFHKRLFFAEKEVLHKKFSRDGEKFDICLFELDKKVWLANNAKVYELALHKLGKRVL